MDQLNPAEAILRRIGEHYRDRDETGMFWPKVAAEEATTAIVADLAPELDSSLEDLLPVLNRLGITDMLVQAARDTIRGYVRRPWPRLVE